MHTSAREPTPPPHTHTHLDTNGHIRAGGGGTEEQIFEKRKVLKEDLKGLTEDEEEQNRSSKWRIYCCCWVRFFIMTDL